MAPTRTSTGRKKIPIQKIENVDALHVCFSKRRHGLFKKAGELSILCGVEIAIIVFSPTGKAYSFGHPSVDAVIERFLQFHPGLRPLLRSRAVFPNSAAAGSGRQADPHRRQTLLQELNRRHAAAVARVEAEKNRNAALQEQWKQCCSRREECNIYKKVEDMNAEEAEAYRGVLSRLVDMVKERRENLLFANRSRPPVLSSPSSTPSFFYDAGGPTVTTPGDCGAVSIDTRQGWII